jgi:hypothetical protein
MIVSTSVYAHPPQLPFAGTADFVDPLARRLDAEFSKASYPLLPVPIVASLLSYRESLGRGCVIGLRATSPDPAGLAGRPRRVSSAFAVEATRTLSIRASALRLRMLLLRRGEPA